MQPGVHVQVEKSYNVQILEKVLAAKQFCCIFLKAAILSIKRYVRVLKDLLKGGKKY